MSPEAFDRLARRAADADQLPFSRRTAVKLAAVALAAAPFGARSASAAAPAGAAQAPNQACLDCKQRTSETFRKNLVPCRKPSIIITLPVMCRYLARVERFIDEQQQGCFGPCPPTLPPTIPQGPQVAQPGPQPSEPVPPPPPSANDECLNCMKVGGKCCPPTGPLCVCANPDYPCSRYGCSGD